jgi:rod shape-determining protein MreD
MTRARPLGLAVMVMVLVALHYSLRPLIEWRVTVDFLTVAVLIVALRARPGAAALVGSVAGLIADSLAPSGFGAAAVALTVVAGLASWIKRTFFTENIVLNALCLFGGKLAFDIVYLLIEGRVTGAALLAQLAGWSVASALVAGVVGVIVLLVFRPMIESTGDNTT